MRVIYYLILLTLVSCGIKVSEGEKKNESSEQAISGIIQAGPAVGATIYAFNLDEGGNPTDKSGNILTEENLNQENSIGFGVSSDDGKYSLNIEETFTKCGAIILISYGGKGINEATKLNEEIASMKTIISNTCDNNLKSIQGRATITPVTTLATSSCQELKQADFDWEAGKTNCWKEVGEMFGITDIDTPPVNLNKEIKKVDSEETIYSTVLAGIAMAAKDEGKNQFEYIKELEEEIKQRDSSEIDVDGQLIKVLIPSSKTKIIIEQISEGVTKWSKDKDLTPPNISGAELDFITKGKLELNPNFKIKFTEDNIEGFYDERDKTNIDSYRAEIDPLNKVYNPLADFNQEAYDSTYDPCNSDSLQYYKVETDICLFMNLLDEEDISIEEKETRTDQFMENFKYNFPGHDEGMQLYVDKIIDLPIHIKNPDLKDYFDGGSPSTNPNNILPDLTISKIEVIPSNSTNDPIEDEPICIKITAQNLNATSAFNVKLNVYLRNGKMAELEKITTKTIPIISSLNPQTILVPFPSDHSCSSSTPNQQGQNVDTNPDTPINHQGSVQTTLAPTTSTSSEGIKFQSVIVAHIDEDAPTDLIQESDEKNNRLAHRPHIRMPDLIIANPALSYSLYHNNCRTTGVSCSSLGIKDQGQNLTDPEYLYSSVAIYADPSASPAVQSDITLSAEIYNQGDADSGSYNICFSVTSPPSNSFSLTTSFYTASEGYTFNNGGNYITDDDFSSNDGSSIIGNDNALTPNTNNNTTTKCQAYSTLNSGQSISEKLAQEDFTISNKGIHTFKVWIDTQGNFNESNGKNNDFDRFVEVVPPPELTIEKINITQGDKDSEDAFLDGLFESNINPIELYVSVGNYDSNQNTASGVDITVYHTPPNGTEETTGQSIATNNLNLQYEEWFRGKRSFNPTTSGKHHVRIVTDYGQSNTSSVEKDFCVLPKLPDLYIGHLEVDCKHPRKSSYIPIDLSINNIGFKDANNVSIKLYYKDNCSQDTSTKPAISQLTEIDSKSLPSLNQTTLSFQYFNWLPPAEGNYCIIAIPQIDNTQVPNTTNQSSNDWCSFNSTDTWDRNTNNDWKIITTTIEDNTAKLKIQNINLDEQNPIEDTPVEIETNVINTGGTNKSTSVTVEVKDAADNTVHTFTSQSKNISTFGCSQSEAAQSFTTSWTPSKEGKYFITSTLNNSTVNTTLTKTIYVKQLPFTISRINSIGGIVSPYYTNLYDADYESGSNYARAQAWVWADSMEHCSGYVCYPWEWEDIAQARVGTGWKFKVSGPQDGATLSHIKLPVEFAGYLDSITQELGATYWEVKIGVGIAKGSSLTTNMLYGSNIRHEYIINAKKPGMFNNAQDFVITAIDESLGDVEIAKKAPVKIGHAFYALELGLFIADLFSADAIIADSVDVNFNNIVLETDTEYIAFIYIDLLTTAVGLTTFQSADFYGRQPHTVPSLKTDMPIGERGIWMQRPEVYFK